FRPFRAARSSFFSHPGLWPGLSSFAPSGPRSPSIARPIPRSVPATLWACIIALLIAGRSPAVAQTDDDDRPQYRPGLVAQFTGPGGKPHRRVDDVLSFVWGHQPPDPRLSAGDFTARWNGRLFSIAPGEYRLHVYAAGAVRITLEKQTLLDARAEKPAWLSA